METVQEAAYHLTPYAAHLRGRLGPLVSPLRQFLTSGTIQLSRRATRRLLCRCCMAVKEVRAKKCRRCGEQYSLRTATKGLNLLLAPWKRKKARGASQGMRHLDEHVVESQWRRFLQAPGPSSEALA